MKTERWQEVRRRKLTDEQIETNDQAIDQEALELTLRELRNMAEMTQEEVAAAMKALQPALSRLEKGQDHKLSSIRRYVEALGGELEVAAIFGKKRIKLSGV